MQPQGFEGDIAIDADMAADIVFGDDLGMLEDDKDWDEIYDMGLAGYRRPSWQPRRLWRPWQLRCI